MTDPTITSPPHDVVAPRRFGLVVTVGLSVLLVDQLSKWWAVSRLSDGHLVPVVGSLQFGLHRNTGAAFSLGSDKGIGPWITVLALVVVITLAFGATSRIAIGAVAAGLVAGGAIGNLADRAFRGDQGFLHGAVIDFIDLQWWPVFNVADAAVVVGALVLVLAGFRAEG